MNERKNYAVVKNKVTDDDPNGLLEGESQLTDMKVSKVSVSEQGHLYAIGRADSFIYVRDGRSDAEESYNMKGDGWTVIDSTPFKWMDAGNNELWGINRYHEVYQRLELNDNDKIGKSWKQVPGDMSKLSSAEKGIVWAVDSGKGSEAEIWVLKVGSITVQKIIENERLGWTLVEKKLVKVDVGYNSQVVGLDDGQDAFFRTGVTKANPMGDGWEVFKD